MATLFVHRLTNLDFAYLDAERGLVGETWLMDVELSATWTPRAWCSISAM